MTRESDRTRWTIDKDAPVTIEESGGTQHVRYAGQSDRIPPDPCDAVLAYCRLPMGHTGDHATNAAAPPEPPLTVYAVAFSNYEPAEVVAVHRSREGADADVAGRDGPYRVIAWEVH